MLDGFRQRRHRPVEGVVPRRDAGRLRGSQTADVLATMAGLGVIVVLSVTALTALVWMGGRPDGTCANPSGCPNLHQWDGLIVLEGACMLLAILVAAATWDPSVPRTATSPSRFMIAVGVVVAVLILAVDPLRHLGRGAAGDWFGPSTSDASLRP